MLRGPVLFDASSPCSPFRVPVIKALHNTFPTKILDIHNMNNMNVNDSVQKCHDSCFRLSEKKDQNM